jgi:hypothetical protein
MELEEIDVIRAKTAQAAFYCVDQVMARRADIVRT